MRKVLFTFLALIVAMSALADDYTAKWKKVNEAEKKDLPQTEISLLRQIANKAENEKQYGHLLKAQLMEYRCLANISPDSIGPTLVRLQEKQRRASDPALKAVYACALGSLYDSNLPKTANDNAQKSAVWFKQALSDPDMLAHHKATDYEPTIIKGDFSNTFGDDLLHVIGMQAKEFKFLNRYYHEHGNRGAACLSALFDLRQNRQYFGNKRAQAIYIGHLDSLINVYRDLPEAGELAIERLDAMSEKDFTSAAQQVQYINESMQTWSSWPRIKQLANELKSRTNPSISYQLQEGKILPNTPFTLYLQQIRNVSAAIVNIYRVNVEGNTHLSCSDPKSYAKLKQLVVPTAVFTQRHQYDKAAWESHNDSIVISSLPVGVYLIEVSTPDKEVPVSRSLLRVSNLMVLQQPLPDKVTRIVVVNATTGAPVSNAKLQLTKHDHTIVTTLTTDSNGEVAYTNNSTVRYLWPSTNDDKASTETYYYTYSSMYGYLTDSDKGIANKLSAYTDRALYRPGQAVHVAAIAWQADKNTLTSKPFTDKMLKFSLINVNGKIVNEQSTTTDHFGTASADFVLPATGLTGRYTISVRGEGCFTSRQIDVEEYKRPTFQVTFEKYKGHYQAGDTISIHGMATTYSGMPVQNAKVAYTINRSQGLWWWRRGNDELIANDTICTTDDGSFSVRLPLTYPNNVDVSRSVFFNFDIQATVTDGAGESREGSISIPLSNRSSILETSLPEKTLKDSLKSFTLNYKNLSGEEIAGTVSYRFDKGQWRQAHTNTVISMESQLHSGLHQLEAICGTDTLHHQFIVFSINDKTPVTETHDWAYLSNRQFPSDGKPVYIQIGSSDRGTKVYYTIVADNKIIEQGSKTINNQVFTRSFTYKDSYGDGLCFSAAWVVKGKLYSHTFFIDRPVPDNRLHITWTTFRNKLTPGQKEQWTMHIASPDGKPAKAQLLSTLYDKSLDAITAHNWQFSNTFPLSITRLTWVGSHNYKLYGHSYKDAKYDNVPDLQFDRFDESLFGQIFAYGVNPRMKRVMMSRASAQNDLQEVVLLSELKENVSTDDMAGTGMILTAAPAPTHSSDATPQLRENLKETAFFYPALQTNDKGDIDISFTLPESVTTWRFLGLAHDSLMNYALTDCEAVASKQVMVEPNMPRFLREGDKATISTRIFNTTDKPLSGRIHLIIYNPDNDQTIASASKPFSTNAKGTATASFDVDAQQLTTKADGQTLLAARIYAEGNGFSDGEQHYLPILPNREQVINTIPFYQNAAGNKDIDLTRLFPADATQRHLTIEYTNNPAWLVVQALPTMANPTQKDALSLASALYANIIGRTIITSSPKMAQTIHQWQQENGNATSLNSNLEKDSELKTMLLDETPWVADANHESDQKRQLAGYLDASNTDYRISTFTTQLKQLQHTDGSFSWWPGMDGNVYMTTAVVETLCRLNHLAGQQSDLDDMLSKAFGYLDQKMADEVKELKRMEKKGIKNLQPSETACHWLYASALANRAKTSDMSYLINLLSKAPTKLTIYGKAGAAVILAQYGQTSRAKEYLQSIREYTVYKEEIGRYFDTKKAQYSWLDYRIPTQTFAIEALKMLTPNDTLTISEMQRWLLNEKRTTSWSTSINSVNAVYAFLFNPSGNADMGKLAGSEQATMYLDGAVIQQPKATAAIGYVKVAPNLNSPTAAVNKLTIEKKSTGTSWGAVYGSFTQKSTQVASAASGIKVTRSVKPTTLGKATSSQVYKVGQKVVVTITIEADRDYDFVNVQDKRAACLEPANQQSGYNGEYYAAPKDNVTNYYFDKLTKGRHVIETTYYIDRPGDYATGICTVQCAYAPEFSGREAAKVIRVAQ